MDHDLLDLYTTASAWTTEKVALAAEALGEPTPCEEWDVRTLLNHMLQTQQYFLASAKGEEASPPAGDPPELLSDHPLTDFERGRQETISAFSEPGAIDKTGPALGIAFSDQLLHGWDLATATGQPTEMPAGLPEAAYDLIHGAFTDEQRVGVFKPEVEVPADASAQDRLLAYTGRRP